MIVQNTHKKWKSIPDQLYQTHDLTFLDVSFNEIDALEKATEDWCHLIHLDLSHNQFNAFPPELRALSSLKVLNIGHNPIGQIPEWISELKSLETLILSNCQLNDLSFIRDLPKLTYLDISYNPFKRLSMNLSSCTKLKSIKMTGNRCRSLPVVLSYLPLIRSIKDLDLSHRLRVSEKYLDKVFILLRRIHKKGMDADRRKMAISFFMNEKAIEKEALYQFLMIAPTMLCLKMREYLIQNSTVQSLTMKNVAIVGECTWIEEKDKSSYRLTNETKYVYLGEKLKRADIEMLNAEHQFITDRQLFDCLNEGANDSKGEVLADKILDLLMSGVQANMSIALEIVSDVLFWSDYLEELFIAYTYVESGNVSLRQHFIQIFKLCSKELRIDQLPRPAFSFKTKRSEEELHRILDEIKQSQEQINSERVARILYDRQGIGYIHIMNRSRSEKLREWLSRFQQGQVLRLSACKKLKELPILDENWDGITSLNLSNCTFRKLPSLQALSMFPDLRVIDLRNNPIRFLPQSIQTEYAAYQILLTRKK